MAKTLTPKFNTTDVNRADYRCRSAAAQCDTTLELVRDLAVGEKAIKAKTKYLPIEGKESVKDYAIRYQRSLLFNTLQKTLNALTGAPFRINPVLDVDVPQVIRRDFEDIDLAGSHGDVFLRNVFYQAVRDGHAFIFVDFQLPLPTSVTSAAPIPDASDDQAAGRRPYWVSYEKDQAFNWASDRINGETVLTRIVFRECLTVASGEYGEREAIRYRKLKLQLIAPASPGRPAVYGPMEWELFEEVTSGGKTVLNRLSGDVTSLRRIPVVVIYTNRTGYLTSDPPLAGLANLNIGHYRQWSDLAEQVRWLTPMAVKRISSPELDKKETRPTINIGRRSVIECIGEHSDFKLVSHDPDCIKPSMDFVQRLEQWMSVEGVSLIAAKDEKQVTLGEKEMDQGERLSTLSLWMRGLSDGAEQAMRFHARYYNLTDGGSIIMTLSGISEDAVKVTPAPLPGPMPEGTKDENAAPVA